MYAFEILELFGPTMQLWGVPLALHAVHRIYLSPARFPILPNHSMLAYAHIALFPRNILDEQV